MPMKRSGICALWNPTLEGEQLDAKEIWDNSPSSPSSADNQIQLTNATNKEVHKFCETKQPYREEQLDY